MVRKNLLAVHERFESTISLLENSKHLSIINLAKLLNSLRAQEQRRLMRSKRSIEGVLPVKIKANQGDKKKVEQEGKLVFSFSLSQQGSKNMIFLLIRIIERKVIHHSNAGKGQTISVRNVRRRDIIKRFSKLTLNKIMLRIQLIRKMLSNFLQQPVLQLAAK